LSKEAHRALLLRLEQMRAQANDRQAASQDTADASA